MKNKNFLTKIPKKTKELFWENELDKVVISVENRGIFNRIMQIVLKKPKVSKIHLDEMGSFIWQNIDGNKTIYDISKELDKRFGQKSQPLYLRLEKFFMQLQECRFIQWEK